MHFRYYFLMYDVVCKYYDLYLSLNVHCNSIGFVHTEQARQTDRSVVNFKETLIIQSK